MISRFINQTIAFTLVHSLLASAQVISGTETSTQVAIPFPIPANSSSVLPDGGSSTIQLGDTTTSSSTSIAISPSTSGIDVPLPVTSTGTVVSSSSSSLIVTSSSIIVSSSVSSSISATDTTPPSTAISSTGPTSNGQPNPGSTTQPPGASSTTSISTGLQLPSGITPPPSSVTILPTGTDVRSSASDLSVVFVGIFPLLNSWIDTPDAPQVTAVTDELDNILPKAVDMLAKFPKPPDGVEPCGTAKRRRSRSGDSPTLDNRSLFGGLFKTAFSLLNCVVDTTNKVKDAIIEGATDAVVTVKKLEDTLKPMIDALNEVEEMKPSGSASEQPTSTEAESSSSSSCTLQTASNCNVHCTAIATTTMGGPRRRGKRDDACTTACEAPITKCGAMGTTAVSTVTSTTTASQYVCARSACGTGCDAHGPSRPDDPIVARYSKAPNGVLYLPAPTAAKPLSNTIVFNEKRSLPRETSPATSSLQKRALSHPDGIRDINGVWGPWVGGVTGWLLYQVVHSPNWLFHGYDNIFTTGFSFPLEATPNTFSLAGLYGCTSVIVISRKRMYMTHIWENPTFTPPGNFRTQALDALRNGDVGTPGLTEFAAAGGDFEDTPENEVRAFIVTPYLFAMVPNQPADSIRYRNEVDQIKALLDEILGRSDTITIPYVSYGPDPDFQVASGKVLIQYDPVNEWSPAEGCTIQFAGIELWVEDRPVPQFRNVWTAFPNQVMPTIPNQVRSPDSLVRRLLGEGGEGKTSAFGEGDWKEYEALRRRQFCARPSESASASSTASSPLSSATQDPTTFQTSVTPSSSADSTTFSSTSTTFSSTPTSSSASPSSATPEFSSSATPESSSSATPESPSSATPESPSSATSEPAPTPSKALSIILTYLDEINEHVTRDNAWDFYETEYGSQADVCSGGSEYDRDRDSEWVDPTAVQSPPWPHTSYTFIMYGEWDCRYFSDGNGAGSLTCPSWNGRVVDCKEDPERRNRDATYRCSNLSYHRAVICEW